MKITIQETERLLKADSKFVQIGFSMLLERLKKLYTQDASQEMLKKCANEINAFFGKFEMIMAADYENISNSLKLTKSGQVLNLAKTSELIGKGKLLHIAGSEALLRKLPGGSWIGGSTEYFIADGGGTVSGELLFVTEFPYKDFSIKSYDASEILNVANDAFENGFSILIVPFDSDVHIAYAENAAGYENIFMRNIAGWIAGVNLNVPGQTPIAVNGTEPEVFTNKAVALHIGVPENKTVTMNIINIFEQDKKSPVIEFTKDGFSAERCLIDGKEAVFADYITENNVNTQLPLVGDYSGNGINISFKSIENGIVKFYAPVFSGIKYSTAVEIPDYAEALNSRISKFSSENAVFSCNCILNFLYGGLEGKKIMGFVGPVTFGEIVYQLVNQTLVYVTVTG